MRPNTREVRPKPNENEDDGFFDSSPEDDDDDAEESRRRAVRLRIVLVGVLCGVLALGAGVVCMRARANGPSSPPLRAQPTSKQKVASTAPTMTSITASTAGSMYCFMVMLPFGNEPKLVKLQYERGLGIFGCDEHVVLSNKSFELSPGRPGSEKTVTFPGDMRVDFNDWTWKIYDVKLALNTGVFIRAWRTIFELGHWRNYAWTVKMDPDTVFFPDRLRYLLRERPLLPNTVAGTGQCGNCKKVNASDKKDQSCAAHVGWMQKDGLTCAESIEFVARPPPQDCGCFCGQSACTNPSSVYLRNCAVNKFTPDDPYPGHALHGPLEVLSNQAVVDFKGSLGRCEIKFKDTFTQWGEDWFLEHCLRFIGVMPVDSFSSIQDGDCATVAWPCESAHAAFQPFKSQSGYLDCTANAMKNGTWPPTGPQYAEHKRWSNKAGMWITKEG